MSEKKITEKDLIDFGFKKIEGDAGISFPYQKEVGSVSKQDIAEKVEDYLFGVADAFDNIKRIGSDTDDPEGSRYIIVSDSMAKKLSHDLRNCAHWMYAKDFQFPLPE